MHCCVTNYSIRKSKFSFVDSCDFNLYDGVIHAVQHKEFGILDFKKAKEMGKIIFDVKGIIPKEIAYMRMIFI